MYVCICNGVTDHQIREAALAGCDSVACLDMAAGLLEQARLTRELPLPMLQAA